MKHVTILLALTLVARAERVSCPVTADTWVAMPRWENPGAAQSGARLNNGGDSKLVVRGRESFALLQFDFSKLKGLAPRRATLRVWRDADPVPLHTVGLSTVSGNGPWRESAASFLDWSYPGSELADVTFGPGGSLYSYPRARDAGGGWWEIDVAPALIAALATGDQFGLMLCDEKGQTQTRHVFSSREGSHPPELLVEAEPASGSAPGPVRALQAQAVLRHGSATVRYSNATRVELRYSDRPVDARNFDAASLVPRWMVDPLAPKPAPMAVSNSLADSAVAVVERLKPGADYYFAARAADAAGRLGPVSPLGRFRAYQHKYPNLATAASPAVPASATAPPRVWAVPETLKINPKTGASSSRPIFRTTACATPSGMERPSA